MKKLLMFTLAVASAAAAQAASFAWSNLGSIKQAGTDNPLTSGTVYLIDGAAGHGGISRNDLWAMVVSGATIDLGSYTWYSATLGASGFASAAFSGSAKPEDQPQIADGVVTITEPIYAKSQYSAGLSSGYQTYSSTPGDAYLTSGSFYEVVVVDGNWYFSEEIPKNVSGQGATVFAFNNADNSLTEMGAGSIDTNGGWYVVPEPTSGLLMLVGLGLLGLRRRRNRE